MNPNKMLWEKGDFTAVAAFMRQSGEAFVDSLGVEAPIHAMDLGCGDGTTAVPLARKGAKVVGIDIASNLVDAGRKRAEETGLQDRLHFREGCATNLEGVEDASFDLSITVFGAMFAPKPFEVAKELVRVTKPGVGRIVMGNWIPNDPDSFVSQLLKISSAYTPPPPEGFVSPMTWGVESHILERFGKAGVAEKQIDTKRDVFHFIAPDHGPEKLIEVFRRYYGPTMNAFEAAEKNGKAEDLQQELLGLAHEHNKNKDGGTTIAATFMRVTVTL